MSDSWDRAQRNLNICVRNLTWATVMSGVALLFWLVAIALLLIHRGHLWPLR